MAPLIENHSHHERRRCGRVKCMGLTCNLGQIIDLSGSGVKVQCRGWRRPRIGAVVDLELACPNLTINVKSQIVWFRRQGLRSYEAAFEFLDVNAELRQKLTELGHYAMRATAIEAARTQYT
ncbi:MAG: PilZ domain-containing protein [Phycisphaeraceae bacterium]|nr:PilZ domain-containing protein [Phycisphaeraceae bacterium]